MPLWTKLDDAVRRNAIRRAVVLGRITFAWLLTSLALPYAWGRSFIGWQLTGRPEPAVLGALIVVALLILGFTYHAGLRLTPRQLVIVYALVAICWIATNAASILLQVAGTVPLPLLIVIYVPGSLLIPWLVWMFLNSWSWRVRCGMATAMFAVLLAFLGLFRVEGLSGDSRVEFTWRRTAGSGDRPAQTGFASRTGPTPSPAPNPSRDWPQFLGPDRNASIDQVQLARDWRVHPPRELWRRSAGAGWGSFAVIDDLAFTQEQRGDQECTVCYRLFTGEELWVHRDPVHFDSSLGGPGPRATPAVERGRVFAIGATGLLNCLDALTGQRLWSVDVLLDNGGESLSHGVCASPLVDRAWVVVCPTGPHGPSLAGYEIDSGKRAWSWGQRGASYSSPILASLAGVAQVLLFDSEGISAHDRESGAPLWNFAWTNSVKTNAAQPIVLAGETDAVLVSTGYDKGCAMIRVDRSPEGNWSAQTLWSNNRLKSKFSSPVVHGGYVYGLDDGILACLELATGERKWKSGRYGHGQILRVADLAIVQAESGEIALVELNAQGLRELGRLPTLHSKTWNHPALAGPFLLVRNDREAACYELVLASDGEGP